MMKKLKAMIGSLVMVVALGQCLYASEMKMQTSKEEHTTIMICDLKSCSMQLKIDEETLYSRPGSKQEAYDFHILGLRAEDLEQKGLISVSIKNEEKNVPFYVTKETKIAIYQGEKLIDSQLSLTEDGALQIVFDLLATQGELRIETKNLYVTIDRTLPEAEYDMSLEGLRKQDATFKEAFIVWAPASGSVNTYKYRVGEKSYITNDGPRLKERIRNMDVAPYHNEKGEIMLPIKYVLQSTITQYNHKNNMISFCLVEDDGRTYVKINLKNAQSVIGNINYTCTSLPEIKEGRLFMSTQDIIKILGKGWEIRNEKEQHGVIICDCRSLY